MRSFMNLTSAAKCKRIWFRIVNYKRWWIYRTLDTLFYFIRTHTYNRYHIINIKSPDNGFRWGYVDADHKMFLAMFKILCDFVENELNGSVCGYTLINVERAKIEHGENSWEYKTHKSGYERDQKLLSLYNWFKNDHTKMVDNLDYYDELYDLETAKMKELIELRGSMWT